MVWFINLRKLYFSVGFLCFYFFYFFINKNVNRLKNVNRFKLEGRVQFIHVHYGCLDFTYGYAALYSCMAVVQASYSTTASTKSVCEIR